MGEVYRARDTRLDRDVAIKVLPDVFAVDRDRLARLEREAKALAALNHPNVAQIYGVEDTGATRAIVMELVEGEDLAQRLARGTTSGSGVLSSTARRQGLPLGDALSIAQQVIEALECAHDAGIVHRDLKPANIKLRPDGQVKVLDFGLAKALEPELSGAAVSAMHSPTLTARGTAMGMIIGTAAYMRRNRRRDAR